MAPVLTQWPTEGKLRPSCYCNLKLPAVVLGDGEDAHNIERIELRPMNAGEPIGSTMSTN